MTGSATGLAAKVRMLAESTYNTAPSGNYFNIPFLTANIGTMQKLSPNPIIYNGSDPLQPLRDVFDGKGDIEVPLDSRYIGLHLTGMFGHPVTSGAGPYTSVYTSGKTGQPISQAFEVSHPALTEFSMNTGGFYDSMDIQLARSGLAKVKFGLITTQETWSGTTGAGTPANLVDTTLHTFSQLTGVIKRAGTALGTILSGNFTFNNNLDPLSVVANNGYINGADQGEAALTGKLTARFRDMTLLNDAIGGSPVEIDWILSNSSSEKITFAMPYINFVRPQVPITGPSGVNITFDFMGNAVSGTPMMTTTLINDYAGTAY